MTAELEPDFTVEQVAKALGMSTRWVRDRVRLDGVEHQKYGSKTRFTADQVAALRAFHARSLSVAPVTTGPDKKRKSA